MSADQREQALAAVDRLEASDVGYTARQEAEDYTLVRAALTPPPLPADLAEIQARHDDFRIVAESSRFEKTDEWVDAAAAALTDVPALVAELAELRARPTLTAAEAEQVEVLIWADPAPVLKAKLRAIAERASK